MFEYHNAVVDVGCSGGVLGARFVKSQLGWHCESIGLQTWTWGDREPGRTPQAALKTFADRWLGLGQGLFCSVLTIARADDAPTASRRPVAFSATPRAVAPAPAARPSPDGETIQTPLARKPGRRSSTLAPRWQLDGFRGAWARATADAKGFRSR